MYLANGREVLSRMDAPETVASAEPLAKSTKAAIWVAVVLAIICSVLAVEINLLHSGELVVVMPE